MMEIRIKLTDADFERLTIFGFGELPFGGWQEQPHRWENVETHAIPSPKWTSYYRYGDSWANVILARAYLEAGRHDYEVVSDVITQERISYEIFTNFRTTPWRGFTRP